MHRSHTQKIFRSSLVPVLFALLSICALARVHLPRVRAAKANAVRVGQQAPSFDVRTLEGVTYTNASLGGSPALLQFWTTSCKGCRDDQAAVDEIDNAFSGQGLVVLAISEGESSAKVQNYLREHPRTVRIVVDQQEHLASRFGKHGYPYYVLIDQRGKIAGTRRGAAGQQGLVSLVQRVGLQKREPVRARSSMPKAKILDVAQDTSQKGLPQVIKAETKKESDQGAKPEENKGAKPEEKQGANRDVSQDQKQDAEGKPAGENPQAAENAKPGETAGESAKPGQPAAPVAEAPPKPPSGMKVIDIAPEKNSHPGQPVPKAVFVLTNGERLESDRYTMDPQFLHIVVEGEERVIPMQSVNVQATESENHARGNDLKVPSSKSEVFVSF